MSGTTWSKFFWSDWESDPALRLCSFAAQGLWMRMLCVAARHDPIGYVAVAGTGLDGTGIARCVGGSDSEINTLLGELERNGVFSRDRHGRIYCRRMVRDEKKARTARTNGRKNARKRDGPSPGKDRGNSASVPHHKPEAISQKPEEEVAVAGATATPGGGARVAAAPKPAGNLLSHWPAWERVVSAMGDAYDELLHLGQHGRVAQWLADGWDVELDIVPTIQRKVAQRARAGGSPIRSLKFFEHAIADAHASRLAPVPKGEVSHVQTHRSDQPALRVVGRGGEGFAAYALRKKAGLA